MGFVRKAWPTRFGSFVGRYTIPALMRGLQERGMPVTYRTVNLWLQGKATPRARHLIAIEEMGRGKITCADIIRHREEVGGNAGRDCGKQGTGSGGMAS